MKRIIAILATCMLALGAAGASAETLEQKIDRLEKELADITTRIEKNERHVATDRIDWYGDFRVKADSLRYEDVRWMGQKYNLHNDILYTSRLRLGMKAKVASNVNFSGRLSMYKNWADSTGVKMMDSFSTTMDGTNGGNTTGDWMRVERAYFDWKDIGGSNFYLSIGRRPSTYGPPSQYRENEMRGGTPSGHLVHFNFDGITAGYKLSDITGIEGQTIRFCYGQGYESAIGNGELMGQSDVRDTHLGGFNIDIINDGTTFVQATLFKATDVTDGFKGLAVMPMSDTDGDGIPDIPNTNGYISRVQATDNIGDLYLGGFGFAREEMNGINWFASFGWTQANPNGKSGPYGGLLSDYDGNTKARDGYSVYAGVQVPAPMGKAGLEYNQGSKYWMPFSIGQDDMIGPKLATRGQVYEGYYIFDVNPKMFIKLGGIYYDYEYTGSGVPVGKPVKVEDAGTAPVHGMMPAIDKAWDTYASLTVKF